MFQRTMDKVEFFGFRYDYNPSDYNHNLWYESARGIIAELIVDVSDSVFGTFNNEVFSKLGDACKPHLHFHYGVKFSGDDSAEKYLARVRKRITRSGIVHTPRCYKLSHEKDVRDIFAFFRYPLKQTGEKIAKHFLNYELFTREIEGWDTKFQVALAKEELAKCGEVGKAKREKDLSRQTTYERMLVACADLNFVGHRDVFRWVLEWLDTEGIPPDSNKVKSFVNGIALKKGLMSPDQYYNELFR